MLQGDDCGARYGLGTAYDACPGGCSGRGECVMGFFRCTGGYFGADCSRSRVVSDTTALQCSSMAVPSAADPHMMWTLAMTCSS